MFQTLFGTSEKKEEPGFFDKLKRGIEKTRAGLTSRIEEVLATTKKIDEDLLEELEYTLISADIGVKTTEEVLSSIRQKVDRNLVNDAGELKHLIREHLLQVLQGSEKPPAALTLMSTPWASRRLTRSSWLAGVTATKDLPELSLISTPSPRNTADLTSPAPILVRSWE